MRPGWLFLLVVGLPAPARAQLAAGDPAGQFQLSDWLTGVDGPTDIAFLADGRAVVTRKSGQVVLVAADGKVLNPAAYQFQVSNGDETGLLGVVRDDQGTLYFYASTGPDYQDQHRVYRGTVSGNAVSVDLDKPVVSGGLAGMANHVGGGLFIHDQQLYIGVGDTGLNRSPPVNKLGECLNHANGKVLRVNLDGSVPADNPLAGTAMATGCDAATDGSYGMFPPDRRIYAWGLRNPWRLWVDPDTGLLWIGDVGETTQEEITVGGKGANHGWPFHEGTTKFGALGGLADCSQMTPASACTAPQDVYTHEGGQASVTGGLAPTRGCGWGAYESRYFFGDYSRGTVWTLDITPDHSGAVPGSRKDFAAVPSPVSFRLGADHALYVVSHDSASIERIAPRALAASCATPPPLRDAGARPPVDAGAVADASRPGTGGMNGGTGGGTGGTGGSPGSGGTAHPPASSGGGCSCQVAGAPGGSFLLLLLALAIALRRTNRPRSR
jgi:MYXO-CTERM domain-containing protein